MALNFPSSPTIGQVYTDSTSGFSYEWDGTVWRSFSAASSSQIKTLDDISGSFDGIETTFALTSNGFVIYPVSSQSLIINLGGVVQDPTDDYSVAGSNLVFSTPPTNGLSFSGVSLGPAIPTDYANNGNVYTRDTFTATAGQTVFTVTGTYTVGYLEVYQNGVRLNEGTDYTATTGNTFTLITPANLNDEIVSIGYKVATLVTTLGQLDNLLVTGIVTATAFYGDGSNLSNIISGVGIATEGGTVGTGATILDFRGAGISTVTVSSGIATINIEGGGGAFSPVNYIIN
jgi:hypothetical protein